MGGRGFKHVNTFCLNDSNTICDVTGFKVKMSDVERRWEGFFVIPEAWNQRQPQDFPVIPQTQQVFKHVRVEEGTEESGFNPVNPL